MDDGVKAALCSQFNLGAPFLCKRLGGTRNQNFLLQTASGDWFVRKRFAGYADEGRIAFDHRVLAFLSDRGVRVARPRKTVAGRTYWKSGAEVWEVFRFVKGDPPRENDRQAVEAVGKALGEFHRAGADFPVRFDKLGLRGETDPCVILEQAERVEAAGPECARPLGRYRKWIAAARGILPDSIYTTLSHTLVHGDVQPANILMEGGEVAAFVDLDWCGWQPRIYDLAFAVLFCCATHETPIQGEDIRSLTQSPAVEPELIGCFLRSYGMTAGPLSSGERAALQPQIVLTWCHCRIAGALKVPKGERAAFLARGPEHLEELLPPGLNW